MTLDMFFDSPLVLDWFSLSWFSLDWSSFELSKLRMVQLSLVGLLNTGFDTTPARRAPNTRLLLAAWLKAFGAVFFAVLSLFGGGRKVYIMESGCKLGWIWGAVGHLSHTVESLRLTARRGDRQWLTTLGL